MYEDEDEPNILLDKADEKQIIDYGLSLTGKILNLKKK